MIVFNENRYRFVFQNPQGPVGLFLGRTGTRVESVARQIITEERLVRSGRYRASIASEVTSDALGLLLRVGSALPIARLLERGSPAHVIRPRSKSALWWDMPNDRGWQVRPGLRDSSEGHPVAFVEHPGTRAYRIMARAVIQVLKGVRA